MKREGYDVYVAHVKIKMPTMARIFSRYLIEHEEILQLRLMDLEYYLSLGGKVLQNEVIWIKTHHLS